MVPSLGRRGCSASIFGTQKGAGIICTKPKIIPAPYLTREFTHAINCIHYDYVLKNDYRCFRTFLQIASSINA